MQIGWRVRLTGHCAIILFQTSHAKYFFARRLEAAGEGALKLVPQRPVLLLTGQLEMDANEIKRIL